MESLSKDMYRHRGLNEDQIIEKLPDALDNGGDINFIFRQKIDRKTYYGTILHYAIRFDYQRLVEYVLSRGASTAIKITSPCEFVGNSLGNSNAVELAAWLYEEPTSRSMYKILTNRSLQLYSSYGLTPLHFESTIDVLDWTDEAKQSLQAADVNATVSTDSPIWPQMTPILVAAKFLNYGLVTRLLDLGADPLVRDPEERTSLHYLDEAEFFDERLFAFDGKNTFDSYTGKSHFHIACHYCEYDTPCALNIVKRYLDQGISPDLPIQKVGYQNDKDAGKVGLHIAAEVVSPKLMELLLQYGAEVDMEDYEGRTALDLATDSLISEKNECIDCLCLLIEAGTNTKGVDTKEWVDFISDCPDFWKHFVFSCITKLTTLSKNLVSKTLMKLYSYYLRNSTGWIEAEYVVKCSKELNALSTFELRKILDNTIIVKSDFKHKFERLNSFDFDAYPIYGRLLKMRFKRDLVEYENKKTIIRQAIPKVQWMFQRHGQLPHLCADLILWNLDTKELNQFMA